MRATSSSSSSSSTPNAAAASSSNGKKVSWAELLQDFFEVATHCLLHSRQIYPAHLFEPRRYLGILVHQSRHPEINAYIRRVMRNCQDLLQQNLVEKVIFCIENENQQLVDQVVMKINLFSGEGRGVKPSSTIDLNDFQHLEEELRSIVLSLMMADQLLPKVPENCNWKLLVVTYPAVNLQEEDVIKSSLISGEWIVDNNQLPEQQALLQRLAQRSHPQTAANNSNTEQPGMRLKPFKSFMNEQLHYSVYAQIFSAQPPMTS